MIRANRPVIGTIIMTVTLLAASACAAPQAGPEPPEIAYGQDMCDECGMLIDEPKFAAAAILADGTPLRFDDAGEMFKYASGHPEAEVKAWFVHDHSSEVWINAEDAHFVVSGDIATPMGYGIAAFETQEDANAFASAKSAKILTFEEVRAAPPSRNGMGK